MSCFRQDPAKELVRWLVFRNRPDAFNQKYCNQFYQFLTKSPAFAGLFRFVHGMYDLYS